MITPAAVRPAGPSDPPGPVAARRSPSGGEAAGSRYRQIGRVSERYEVSVVAHGAGTLYVVDTSLFPSIGAMNPALTAMANAIRVGDQLLSRMA